MEFQNLGMSFGGQCLAENFGPTGQSDKSHPSRFVGSVYIIFSPKTRQNRVFVENPGKWHDYANNTD